MHNQRVSSYAKGLMGEDHALAYLQNRGMVLLERRYRSPYGEVDLIVRDGEQLVFVEVKARSRAPKGAGLTAITPAKQRRLLQAASMYLAQNHWTGSLRFDVVEITQEGICHIQNAFDATGFEG